jgi:hypothetical protein
VVLMVIAVIRLVSLQLSRIEIYHYNSPISNRTIIILILPKLCHILHLCALEPISRMYTVILYEPNYPALNLTYK